MTTDHAAMNEDVHLAKSVLAAKNEAGFPLWKPWALDLADAVIALVAERDEARQERDELAQLTEQRRLAGKRILDERNTLETERDTLVVDRDTLAAALQDIADPENDSSELRRIARAALAHLAARSTHTEETK